MLIDLRLFCDQKPFELLTKICLDPSLGALDHLVSETVPESDDRPALQVRRFRFMGRIQSMHFRVNAAGVAKRASQAVHEQTDVGATGAAYPPALKAVEDMTRFPFGFSASNSVIGP